MDFTNFIAVIFEYLHPPMMVVVVFLWVFGYMLKRTPNIEDWMIIWILSAIGIISALFIIGFVFEALIQGILAAGIAVYVHQLIKQTTKKRD